MNSVELVDVTCPLCNLNSSRRYARYYSDLFSDETVPMSLVRCVNCDLIFVSPRPRSEDVEALYESDTFTADQHKETVGRGRLPSISDIVFADKAWKVEKLEEMVGGGRLLDIGCGFGAMMKLAEDRGWWHAYGIDPSPAAVRFVREAWGLNLQCKSVFEMDFPPGFFDAVCMDNVLEHIDRPVECMQAVRRVLRPDGVVFIDVPYIRGLTCRLWRMYLKVFPKEGHPNTYGHIYFYTRKSISILLRKAGFEPTLMLTDQTTFPGSAVGAERLLRSAATSAGRALPRAGNLLIAFAVKK